MRYRKTLAAALALSLGVVAAGCGGSGTGLPSGASVAPKNAPLFISLVTKPGSPQWKQALTLVRHFPGGRAALARPAFREALPTLGDETDLVWLDLRNGENDLLGLTKPRQPAKFDALLAKGSNPSVHTVVDGWTVFADRQVLLRRFKAAQHSGSLSDDAVFKKAYDRLPGDAVAKAFLRGSTIDRRIQRSLARSSFPLTSVGTNGLESLSAALLPEANGVKLNVDANGNLPGKPSTFTPELPNQLGAGALAYISFSNLEGSLRHAFQRAARLFPQVAQVQAQIETLGGFSVDKDLLPLFAGEGAVALYEGKTSLAPAYELALKISDESAAKRVVSGLTTLARFSKKAKIVASNVQGIPFTQVSVSKKSRIDIAVFGGTLVVTNDPLLISGTAKGVKLADDPTYKAAAAASGLPSSTSGFVYANVPRLANYELGRKASQSHRRVNPAVTKQVSHLGGLLLYSQKNGGDYDFAGFLGIH